jgi:AcrR family transcriptional regulator
MSRPATRMRATRPPEPPAAGLRERNKAEKLQRIRAAARDLFVRKGFDETTTREIALQAGVGIGTVFIYAENKRDLLFLIANDDLEDVTRKAEAGIRQDASCLQNLLSFFRHHYRFFARQPELSRYLLREMTFYDSGRQAKRFQETRERNIRAVGEIVRIAAANRTIAKLEEPAFVGWVAFCVFQVELRRWLMEGDLNLATGMARLESALRLCMTGWGATPEALAKRRDA